MEKVNSLQSFLAPPLKRMCVVGAKGLVSTCFGSTEEVQSQCENAVSSGCKELRATEYFASDTTAWELCQREGAEALPWIQCQRARSCQEKKIPASAPNQ